MAETIFGDTAQDGQTTVFGDAAAPMRVPFGAVPPGQGLNAGPGGASSVPDPRAFERAVELADPFLQGMTFGFGDELTAAVSPASLEEVRARSERIEQEQPGAALAAELAGGLLTASRLGPVGRAGAALPIVRNLPSLAQFGLGGAAAGAVAGAGTAEGGVQERLEGAGEGATVGAALGVALPVAGRAAAAALTPLLNRTQGATREAIKIIRNALRDDRMTPEQARDQLRELGVDAMIADVAGENVRGTARAAQAVPGPARNLGREALDARQAGQVQRIANSIEENLGAGTEFRQTREQLAEARRTAAQPLYEGAYEIGIPVSDEMAELFSRPSIQRGFARAREIAREEGDAFPDILDAEGNLLPGPRAIPTRAFDYLQRALADTVEGDRNAITGAVTTQIGRAVDKTRRDLLDLVDRENPVFAAARGIYAGDSASIGALEQGRRLGRGLARQSDEFDPEQIYDDLERMNEGEKAFFRQGLARGLIDAAEATSDTANAVRRIVGTEARRGRLRAAFPDGTAFTRFMSDMARERQFFDTGTDVLTNSITGRLGAEIDQRLAGTTGELRNPLRGGLFESAGRVLGQLRTPSPAVRSEIGRLVFAQGPEALLAVDEIAQPRFTRQVLANFANPQPLPEPVRQGSIAALINAERQAASQ